jgi:hypothetical protein
MHLAIAWIQAIKTPPLPSARRDSGCAVNSRAAGRPAIDGLGFSAQMDAARDALAELLFDRVAADPALSDQAGQLVLAAFDGPAELDRALDGALGDRPIPSRDRPDPSSAPGSYLRSISVAGFRGIGPKVQLDLRPGPGLTIVTGRNGSAKSSRTKPKHSAGQASKPSTWEIKFGTRFVGTESHRVCCASQSAKFCPPTVCQAPRPLTAPPINTAAAADGLLKV